MKAVHPYDHCAPRFSSNCLSALRGDCTPLLVCKNCHCTPQLCSNWECAEIFQKHCAGCCHLLLMERARVLHCCHLLLLEFTLCLDWLLLLLLPPLLPCSSCSALMPPVVWCSLLLGSPISKCEGCCCSVRHGLLPAAGAPHYHHGRRPNRLFCPPIFSSLATLYSSPAARTFTMADVRTAFLVKQWICILPQYVPLLQHASFPWQTSIQQPAQLSFVDTTMPWWSEHRVCSFLVTCYSSAGRAFPWLVCCSALLWGARSTEKKTHVHTAKMSTCILLTSVRSKPLLRHLE